MKKLNIGNINAGLDTIKALAEQNAGIAHDELIDINLIDFAEKNSYAADDTEENIRDLADQIETVGLLNPLGVIQNGNRYTLFSGERRYKAITEHLKWDRIPCRVFEGVSPGRAQLMLHVANGTREYSPARKLALYEEYRALLDELKASGEFRGGIQKGIAELLNVSDRQVRTYRVMSEELTPPEKEAVTRGDLSFGEAQNIASGRAAIKAASPIIAEEHAKSGSTSAFEKTTAPAETAPKPEPRKPIVIDQKKREKLLTDAILSGHIWNCEDLYDYYIEMMPTPQEAIKEIIKPRNNFQGGSIDLGRLCGHYDCNATKLILKSSIMREVAVYTYSEVDAMIRKLYRDAELCPERQREQMT